ncbi:MAG: efpA 1 [Pseudonocardiales bacterium]|nr:efpA 1 [Pseudonocardiales bacterium]
MATKATPEVTDAGAHAARQKTIALFIIAGAQLMIVLDATIVNIALPQMGEYFEVSQTTMTWALNAYTLAFGGLLLLGGKAGDLFGRKQMFQVGLGLFTLGSFMAGIAPTFGIMLAGRVVQGIGGAIASPTALSLIVTEFEEGPERTRAFGVFSAVSGGGAALGLLLGGILTDLLDWRWVLFVNLPIGVVLIYLASRYLHHSDRLEGKFDAIGGIVSTLGLFSLVYGFIHAAESGWSQPLTIAALAVGVGLLAVFVIVETRVPEPMMPLAIFKDRNRTASYIVMLIVGAGMFGMFYFLTFFVQGVLMYSPLKSGFAFLPVALGIGISAQVAGKLLPIFGPKPLIVGGAILDTIGLLLLTRLDADSAYASHILLPMVIVAAGMGPIFVSVFTVAVSGLTREESGLGSALVNVMQQIGSSLGLSVLATVAGTAARNASADKLKDLSGESAQHFGQFAEALTKGGQPPADALADPVAMRAFLEVQAHSASSGFLAATCFAGAAVIAALVLIKMTKAQFLETAGGEAKAPVHAG